MARSSSLINLALLISGSGTTAEAIIKTARENNLGNINPVVVISSDPNAGGIKKAETLNIPAFTVEREKFNSQKEFGEKILEILNKYNVNLVSQNGWLPLTPANVVNSFVGRIINQHPGPLDPGRGNDFGGKGMFGSRVTAARIAYSFFTNSNFWTEATTHFVNENFDDGNLIKTIRVDFSPLKNLGLLREKTLELQKELLPLEHQNVIETLKLFAESKVKSFRRDKQLVPEKNYPVLEKSKALAIELFPMVKIHKISIL